MIVDNSQYAYWIDNGDIAIAYFNDSDKTYTTVDADKTVAVWHNKICNTIASTEDPTWKTNNVDISEEYENVLVMGILYEMYMLDPGRMSEAGKLFMAYEKKVKDMKKEAARNSKYKTHVIRPVDY
jgi:hypothetical protein